jgi:hypothetical protein
MSPEIIAAFLKKNPPPVLMLDKPAAHIEYELVDRADIGKELFEQLKQLEKQTLDCHRAFRIKGDVLLIASEHLNRFSL